MLSLKRFGNKKNNYLTTLMSKTNKKREEELALSKNHGANIKYRKRLVEDQEAQEERERALQELEYPIDETDYLLQPIKRPV